MPSFFPDTFLSSVPRGTSLAGLDIGAKTIGVAVSDTLWLTATPLKTIFRKSFQYDMNELSALLKGREIGGFISGLPLQMNGEEGTQAAYTREQAQKIADYFQKPVYFQDERLSSAAVERVMIGAYDMSRKKRREKLDAGAAAFILQSFLDKVR
ncbi:MAG: Holliday junction resolvase RuvX [Alphaproteobacteria bacterium]|nr:Holliday junction resolvase RuvX [Alphaproteobacteria bacterium]